MLVKNVTVQDLESALERVNQNFGGNVRFRSVTPCGKNIRFTLTVNNSRGPGGRLGHVNNKGVQRHIASACWHVHGEFFDALPPAAVIVARGKNIRPGDPWQDDNIGGTYHPLYFSEACDCDHKESK